MQLVEISEALRREVEPLRFGSPVRYVYNPLYYAWQPHRRYLERFGHGSRPILLLGMNPGPFGMAQTGVPFGDVEMVREWIGIEADVDRPPNEHPKRLVKGFQCGRREVSGQRLWGWARQRFATPERFFSSFYVANYCPLVFMTENGRNHTPNSLRSAERGPLFEVCDRALRATVDHLNPDYVVGIGQFAEQRAIAALSGRPLKIGRILHPSPASPAANRGWDTQAEAGLRAIGIDYF